MNIFISKLRRNSIRNRKKIAVLCVCSALLLAPLLALFIYISGLEISDSKKNKELLRQQILGEMNEFEEDLKTENYISKAFNDLEYHLNLPDLDADTNKYVFFFDEDQEPDYIKSDFVSKATHFLKEKYGIVPFLLISSGYDFKDSKIQSSENIFKNEAEKETFLLKGLGSIIEGKVGNIYALRPTLEKSKNTFQKMFNKIAKYKVPEENYDLKQVFGLEFAKRFSLFHKQLTGSKICKKEVSNTFDNQYIYQYHNSLVLTPKGGGKNLLGLYCSLIKSSDIDLEKLISSAENTLSQKNGKLKRAIVEKRIKTPNWSVDEDKVVYNSPFPIEIYNFIARSQTLESDEYNRLINYLENHSLQVSIKLNSNDNYYYKSKLKVLSVILFIGVITFLLIINNLIVFFKFRLPLSLKLRLTVFMCVTIPVAGIWIVSQLAKQKENNLIVHNTKRLISERLDFLDKLKNDSFNFETLNIIDYKKAWSDNYFLSSPEKFYKDMRAGNNEIASKKWALVKKTIHLDIEGNGFTKFFGSNPLNFGPLPKMTSITTMYKILSDMELLDRSTETNKKNLSKQMLVSSYKDFYEKLYNSRNILALEGFRIPEEGFTNRYSIIYSLLASKDDCYNPKALLTHNVDSYNIILNFNYLINSKYPYLLKQKGDFSEIEYAIFYAQSERVELLNPKNRHPINSLLLNCANTAMITKNSNFNVQERDDSYIIEAWRYYNDNPIILTALAVIHKDKNNNGKILGILLFIYGLLTVALLSDAISSAILLPIATLSKFVKEIKQGFFYTKTSIESGDELEELSYSFNKMSDGLCEREKLKRFVSDKLYKSIENSEDSDTNKAKVTILSSDIRNFTTISEKNEPETIVSLLNDYFTLMEKCILSNGGSIEKIVGDAISAAFYEEKEPEHALKAYKAAIEMRESLKGFNEERAAKGLLTIENGIGLATGEVIIGFVGEETRRKEFLLIGEVIKSAEKLESMTKNGIASKIFVDKSTYDSLSDQIKFCPANADSTIFYREIAECQTLKKEK